MKKFAGDIIILHMCTKNHNHNDLWFLRYGVRQTEFFVIMDSFFFFFSPMDPKNQNYEKMKKTLPDIILEMLSINHSHIIYGFSKDGVQQTNFFVILDRSLPFYHPNNPKN